MLPRRLVLFVGLALGAAGAQQAETPRLFTRADTLRGSNGPARSWWDATFYDLHVAVSPTDSSIRGRNAITYRVLDAAREMQIDLQVPMQIDSIIQDGKRLTFRRDSNAFFVTMPGQRAGETRKVTVFFHGKPRAAKRPPWDGGFIWATDSLGNRFIATANEGLGASVWWPNKDIPSDEPDSQRVAITVPDSMTDVSNGRLRSVTKNSDGTTWEWFVSSPINNYSVAVNAGRYAHFTDYYAGERGMLTMDYYPLAIHEDTARVQFRQSLPMMRCFEHWFGPYPWYSDGFKLVEAPHLGMEHQSAVAYGNKYKNGYLGRDRSNTGRGLKWDFIIVHESAHEWWGNSISAKDHADMWIHESFANYAESLFTECLEGKKAGAEYVIGSRAGIRNDRPVIGQFGVNDQGSGDMYPKGGAVLHMIRTILGDDEKWRSILRGANATFWHQAITGDQLRAFINTKAGVDFSRVFEQYQTTTKIPVLEYRVDATKLSVRWTNVVDGFDMPVDVAASSSPEAFRRIHPTTRWSSVQAPALAATDSLVVDPNFYVEVRRSSVLP
ncbi:MAG TPA: M1 family metallopeptidase [Gemmatimonadaceae bacterium]|nr:M1 family metallopeptidase [Gemmatimonadaceae bacterium]